MEKSKFNEAAEQMEIIKCCDSIVTAKQCGANLESRIARLLDTSKAVERSFFRWVQNEKEIATQKFKEL